MVHLFSVDRRFQSEKKSTPSLTIKINAQSLFTVLKVKAREDTTTEKEIEVEIEQNLAVAQQEQNKTGLARTEENFIASSGWFEV